MKICSKRIALSIVMLILTVSIHAQCAMCKGQLESTSESHVGMAVNDGILYLLSLPFLLVITGAVLIWNQKRKGK
ncbi:MAG: hypothetical protein AB8F95_16505 [Bacteroidia bacterium]